MLKVGALITVNSEKTFNIANHSYLFECLKKPNFNGDIDEKISTLYQGCEDKVIANQLDTRPFQIKWGVSQGCPLSAALFIISIEPFIELTKKN